MKPETKELFLHLETLYPDAEDCTKYAIASYLFALMSELPFIQELIPEEEDLAHIVSDMVWSSYDWLNKEFLSKVEDVTQEDLYHVLFLPEVELVYEDYGLEENDQLFDFLICVASAIALLIIRKETAESIHRIVTEGEEDVISLSETAHNYAALMAFGFQIGDYDTVRDLISDLHKQVQAEEDYESMERSAKLKKEILEMFPGGFLYYTNDIRASSDAEKEYYRTFVEDNKEQSMRFYYLGFTTLATLPLWIDIHLLDDDDFWKILLTVVDEDEEFITNNKEEVQFLFQCGLFAAEGISNYLAQKLNRDKSSFMMSQGAAYNVLNHYSEIRK